MGSNLQRGTLLGDTVYFSARDAIYGPQMWARHVKPLYMACDCHYR